MTQETELKPCPFCGAGSTSIRENGKVWTGQRYSEPTSVSVLHHCDPFTGQPSRSIERVGRDLEGAVAAWNRRAALEAKQVEVKMPEYVGIVTQIEYLKAPHWVESRFDATVAWTPAALEFKGGDKLYTESQLRTLLAQHGIKIAD